MASMLETNTPAPNFTLVDNKGDKRSLSDYRGKNVVLAFYPADWSGVCTSQLALYQATIDQIRSYNAEVLGVSVDGRASHRAWAEHQKLTFPILSDFWPHGAVAQQYGVMREKDGISERAIFIIDENGVIKSTWKGEHPGIAPGLDVVFGALQELAGDTTAADTSITDDDWSAGPADARITLLEYGDFECPHCATAHDVINEVRAELGDQLRFVYRHFPLPSHPHAFGAAEAAEAAGAQAKFWPMHDLLYANQKQLELDDLVHYAEQLDLDVARFRQDLEQRSYRDAVQADMHSGIAHGVTGTPTLYINGERYAGPRTRDALLDVLKQG